MVNCRFTVAIHVLCLLAALHPKPVTSEFIAGSVNTNPVVIRRILAVLRRAGLVKSQPGVSGGWELLAKPEHITLGGLYQIVRPGTVFAMHSQQPNVLCPVGRNIQRGLGAHYQKAQAAMEAELDRTTIADVLKDVLGTSP
jgi:Rrf2 family protein